MEWTSGLLGHVACGPLTILNLREPVRSVNGVSNWGCEARGSLVSRSVSPVGKTSHTGCVLVRAAPDGDWQMNIGLSILFVRIESTFYSQDTIIPDNSFISGLQNSLERAQQVAALFKSAFAQFR